MSSHVRPYPGPQGCAFLFNDRSDPDVLDGHVDLVDLNAGQVLNVILNGIDYRFCHCANAGAVFDHYEQIHVHIILAGAQPHAAAQIVAVPQLYQTIP